jgi:hypothetical protein
VRSSCSLISTFSSFRRSGAQLVIEWRLVRSSICSNDIQLTCVPATGATIAGISAAAAYVDAKYHIRKDLANIIEGRRIEKLGQRLGERPRADEVNRVLMIYSQQHGRIDDRYGISLKSKRCV